MEGKEVDNDLTMINKEQPSATDAAVENVVSADPPAKKRGRVTGSVAPVINTQKEYDAEAASRNVQQQFASSFEEGVVDPSLDSGRSMFEDTNSVRARNQSGAIKGLKAVGGGILQGGMIALEQAGYVADIDTYANLFKETEDLSGNWWTRLMKEGQEGLRETDTFKIYEDAPDENSIAAQIFKWSSLEGAVSSAVGFGVTGLGAAKLVSYLGSMRKFKEMAKFTDATLGNITGKSMAGWTGEKAGPLASSMISNYFMGQMMATDTYNQTMEQLTPFIGEGEGKLSKADAQKKAAGNAQDVVGLNMALTMTSYLRFGGIFKRDARLKGLVENPTMLNQTKNLIKTGSPTAFTENVYQEMIQMEQIEDTKQELGVEGEYSKNYWDRMANLALSNRALHAGALGIAGGPIQFAMIQRPMMGKQIARQKEVFDKQKDFKEYHEKLVLNNFAKSKHINNMVAEAAASGKVHDAKFVDSIGVLDELAKSVDWGSIGHLKKSIEDISNMSDEQRQEANYQENYKELAADFLQTIEKAETLASDHAGMENRGEIVFNVLAGELAYKDAVELTTKANELHSTIVNKAASVLGVDPSTIDPGTLKYKTDVSPEVSAKLKGAMEAAYEFKQIKDTDKDIKKRHKFMADLNTRYNEIITPEFQANYKKSQDTKTSEVNSELAKDQKATADEAAKKEASKYRSFASVEGEVKQETAEETEAREKAWLEDQKDEEGNLSRSVERENTFTGIDLDKESGQYTPGELRRSTDGRVFKVEKQLGAKGLLAKSNMPVLQEMELIDGKYKEVTSKDGEKIPWMAQRFVLGRHSFLRPEALQLKWKTPGQYNKVWAPYVRPDSPSRPNDAEYQEGRRLMLGRGQAKTINISAREIKAQRYPWLDDYDTSKANKPFKEPYRIQYKINHMGDGQTGIDVIEVSTGAKIARLDKDYNLNFQHIIDALISSPNDVYGEVVGNYSSEQNIHVNKDDNGQSVYTNISEMSKMDKSYLPNGRIVLMTKKGSKDGGHEIASYLDGEVIKDNEIIIDGRAVKIPFHSIRAGDMYAAIIGPGGLMMPVATTSKNVGEIKGENGQTMVEETLIPAIEESIDRIHAEYLDKEGENDSKLRAKLTYDNTVVGDGTKNDFKWKKKSMLSDKYEAFEADIKKTVYQYIRPKGYFIREVHKNENAPQFETDKSGKRKINPTYFEVTFDVAESNGKIVPAVKVRNEANTWEKTRANSAGGAITYNIVDHPGEFMEAISKQRLKLSADMLLEPVSNGVNVLQETIKKGLITTDLNMVTPFLGSSLTTQITDKDVLAAATKYEQASKAKHESKYAAVLDKGLRKSGEINAKETANIFAEEVREFLDTESEAQNIAKLSAGTTDEIAGVFHDFLVTLDINQSGAVKDLADRLMYEDLTEEQTLIVDGIQADLADRRITNNGRFVSRVSYAMQQIQEKVNAGTFTLKIKRDTSTQDSTGRYVQPDGILHFSKGASVFVPAYGQATVFSHKEGGKYVIKDRDGTSHRVYPQEVYALDGKAHSLFKKKRELSRTKKTDPAYKAVADEVRRQENILEADRQERDGTIEEKNPTGTASTNALATDYYKRLAIPFSSTFQDTISQSERSTQLTKVAAALEEFLSTDENQNDLATEPMVESVRLAAKDAAFYSYEELSELSKLAKEDNNKQAEARIENFRMVKQALDDVGSVNQHISLNAPVYVQGANRPALITIPYISNKAGYKTTIGDLNAFVSRYSKSLVGVVKSETVLRSDLFSNDATPTVESNEAKKENTEIVTPKVEVKEDVKPQDIVKGDVSSDIAHLTDLTEGDRAILDMLSKDHRASVIAEYTAYWMEGEDTTGVMERAKSLWDVPFKKGTQVTTTPKEFKAEVRAIKEMLPQIPVEVLENVTAMYNKYGVNAIGAYDRGVRYLVDRAQAGTGYHETFHAVAGIYLRSFEKKQIAEERGAKSWTKDMEEALADEFADYVKKRNESKLTGAVRRFFTSIFDWIKGARSVDVTTKIFEKIASGGYATSENLSILNEVGKDFSSPEQFEATLSEDNKVLLQELVRSKRIKIVC